MTPANISKTGNISNIANTSNITNTSKSERLRHAVA
jgi:hypothetical protein